MYHIYHSWHCMFKEWLSLLLLLEQPHTLVCGCSYILPLWFFFIFFFISASLISAVSAPISLKFGTPTGSWCNLWSPVPNGGYAPPQKILGAKNWKIAIGAYSSEPITPERKRISERLKRLCNRKRMAYKAYVRPWPLAPGCKHSERLCTYKCKKFQVFGDFLKIFCGTPPL